MLNNKIIYNKYNISRNNHYICNMDKQVSYPIILEGLKRKFQNRKTEEELRSLAESVSGTIVYAPDLKGITEDFIREAIEDLENPTYTEAMGTIREYFKKGLTRADKTKLEAENREASAQANWKYLVESWDAFKKDGDLRSIMQIKITFLSRWIISNPSMITENEIEWCRNKSRELATRSLYGDREQKEKNYLCELLVLYVIKKMQKSEVQDPGKVSAFIEKKREAYNDWFLSKYGEMPEWNTGKVYRRGYIETLN